MTGRLACAAARPWGRPTLARGGLRWPPAPAVARRRLLSSSSAVRTAAYGNEHGHDDDERWLSGAAERGAAVLSLDADPPDPGNDHNRVVFWTEEQLAKVTGLASGSLALDLDLPALSLLFAPR